MALGIKPIRAGMITLAAALILSPLPAAAMSWHCTVPALRSEGYPLEALYTSWSRVITVCHGPRCGVVRLSEASPSDDGFVLTAQRREETWTLRNGLMSLSAVLTWPKEIGGAPTTAAVVLQGTCEQLDQSASKISPDTLEADVAVCPSLLALPAAAENAAGGVHKPVI